MQLQTKFFIWLTLYGIAFLADGYMIFLYSQGVISGAMLALSPPIIHSIRGTLSLILFGPTIIDVIKQHKELRQKAFNAITSIDNIWKDVAFVGIIIVTSLFLFGFLNKGNPSLYHTDDPVDAFTQESLRLEEEFKKNEEKIQQDIALFTKQIEQHR